MVYIEQGRGQAVGLVQCFVDSIFPGFQNPLFLRSLPDIIFLRDLNNFRIAQALFNGLGGLGYLYTGAIHARLLVVSNP